MLFNLTIMGNSFREQIAAGIIHDLQGSESLNAKFSTFTSFFYG